MSDQVKSCVPKLQAMRAPKLMVEFVVDGQTGATKSVVVVTKTNRRVDECVMAAAKRVKFKRFGAPDQSFQHPYKL